MPQCPTELAVLYVDGVKVNSDKANVGKQMFLPKDYHCAVEGEPYDPTKRTPINEYLCIGSGSHNSGYPSWGPEQNTTIVVARVYGKALTQAEVTALYNYHKPE